MSIATLSAADFAELLSGPILDIYVGSESTPHHYALHANLLAHHSPFFSQSAPINGEPRQIIDGKLLLADEDPDAFCILVKWLYQGTIIDVSTMPEEKKWEYAYTCQKLYFLCERVGIQDLKNIAMDNFRRGCYEAGLVPGAEEMKPVYERTPPGSPFRKLVSRIAARQIMDPDSKRDADVYRECFTSSPDFAIDVLNAIRDGTDGFLMDDPTEHSNSCRWHEHEARRGSNSCGKKTVTFEAGVKAST